MSPVQGDDGPRASSVRAGKSRGQSLVEFALVLPILLFLTLMALDFGRIYLGWINLQNMTRIAANYAANHPDAFGGTPPAQYTNQVKSDALATNCKLPPVAQWVPAFADGNGDGTATGLGDTANVQITCQFDIITPVISAILGNSVSVSAESTFPVKSGLSAVAGAGGGGGGAGAPNAAFLGNGVVADTTTTPTLSNTTPFDVEFRDTSGGAPSSWSWDFGDGATSSAQDPLIHRFTCLLPTCTFNVSMRASNAAGSSTARMTVIVVQAAGVDFSADRQVIDRTQSVQFTNLSTAGGTAFLWNFGDGGTSTQASPSHTYNSTAGSPFTVSLTVTYPAPTGAVTLAKTGFITVNVGTCRVPSLNGVKFNSAQGVWTGAGFTGTVGRGPGAPSGNFTITAQNLVANEDEPCNSNVLVNRP